MHENWTHTLHMLSQQPLEFCPDFPHIARRHEAFWRGEGLGYPLFLAEVNSNPGRPITRRLEYLHQPEAWLEAKLLDMQQTYRVGDTLPNIRVDFGPVMLGGLFGAAVEFQSDTTWTHEFIYDDWSNAPDWTIDENNTFWQQLQTLAQIAAEDARGRYLVRTPDLGGSGDVLLNMRGSAQLAMDVIDQPEKIEGALQAIYPAWQQAFEMLYNTITASGAGIIHWLALWSDEPYMIPACDFNALISPRSFRRLFLPDIQQQASTAGRAIFHLDGPDAARHVDSLIEAEEIHAIQYVPGAGTPSALAKVDMLNKIQVAGKPLYIVTPFDEVLELCDLLQPEGLAIQVDGIPDVKSLDRMYAAYCDIFGIRNRKE